MFHAESFEHIILLLFHHQEFCGDRTRGHLGLELLLVWADLYVYCNLRNPVHFYTIMSTIREGGITGSWFIRERMEMRTDWKP